MNGQELIRLYQRGKRNFRRASLSGAIIRVYRRRRGRAYGANLREIDLSEANLSEADLFEANLRKADLSRADLSKANLNWVTLRNAKLWGASLTSFCRETLFSTHPLAQPPEGTATISAGSLSADCHNGRHKAQIGLNFGVEATILKGSAACRLERELCQHT